MTDSKGIKRSNLAILFKLTSTSSIIVIGITDDLALINI